jgi:hypothetical protein
MDARSHKERVASAMRGFAARSRTRVFSCKCGLDFQEKRDYYRHKYGNRCEAREPKEAMPKQLNLFGGR